MIVETVGVIVMRRIRILFLLIQWEVRHFGFYYINVVGIRIGIFFY